MTFWEILRVNTGPISEPELKKLEAEYLDDQGSGYIPVRMLKRLVDDNRRLRNLLLDYMDADGNEE